MDIFPGAIKRRTSPAFVICIDVNFHTLFFVADKKITALFL